jgi:hypothetical protein
VAEWSGKALQKLLQQFESARNLRLKLQRPADFDWQVFAIFVYEEACINYTTRLYTLRHKLKNYSSALYYFAFHNFINHFFAADIDCNKKSKNGT